MNIQKFKEKAIEFIKEHKLYVPNTEDQNDLYYYEFSIRVITENSDSNKLYFGVGGLKRFEFDVIADDFDELFDKAYRILKAYGPKPTRERKVQEEEE